jgi:hypothetical protein
VVSYRGGLSDGVGWGWVLQTVGCWSTLKSGFLGQRAWLNNCGLWFLQRVGVCFGKAKGIFIACVLYLVVRDKVIHLETLVWG